MQKKSPTKNNLYFLEAIMGGSNNPPKGSITCEFDYYNFKNYQKGGETYAPEQTCNDQRSLTIKNSESGDGYSILIEGKSKLEVHQLRIIEVDGNEVRFFRKDSSPSPCRAWITIEKNAIVSAKVEYENIGYWDHRRNERAEDEEPIPLFIEYTANDVENHNNRSAMASFEDIIQQISGTRKCYFIHQRGGKKYELNLLSVSFDDIPICMTVTRAANIDYILRSPHFIMKKKVLPDEGEYLVKQCRVNFVPKVVDTAGLLLSSGQYWLSHWDEITQFINSCFNLPIPAVEIEIEKDKEMWNSYLDGLKALLDDKRALIKIQSVDNKGNGLLQVNFDTDSYVQEFKDAILEKLEGACEHKAQISVVDGRCEISFNGYQIIKEETIDEIKKVGDDYFFSAEDKPVNMVSGEISIVSDDEEINGILSDIEKEMEEYDAVMTKVEKRVYRLDNDKSVDHICKYVDAEYRGIASVTKNTKIVMPLTVKEEAIDKDFLTGLPENVKTRSDGKYFSVISKKPLNTELEVFKKLDFYSCELKVTPQQIDPNIQIEGATIIDGRSYLYNIDSIDELEGIGRLFNKVVDCYDKKQLIYSQYVYFFIFPINKEILKDLKTHYIGDQRISIDVPRSRVEFSPSSEGEYDSLKEDFLRNLDSSITAVPPIYAPTVNISFKSEDRDERQGIFEKVNNYLVGREGKFIKYELDSEARRLSFKFTFENPNERDEIEKVLKNASNSTKAVAIFYDGDNDKGVTTLKMYEDKGSLQERRSRLLTEFRNEEVKYINGAEYDKLSDVSEDELNVSTFSKDKIIKNRRQAFLKDSRNVRSLGKCRSREIDSATIIMNEEMMAGINELGIKKGDYIQFPALGETMELMRQKRAMLRILNPGTKNSPAPANDELPNFIFDPKYAREISEDIEGIKESIGRKKVGNLNEKQLEAVAKSVYAQDISLIQGPPGTGKTTVIAEIILQEIRNNPDLKILLTSQTNIAVDNALERLQDQVGIRPVRIGKPDKIGPEGLRFYLPAIDNWAREESSDEDNATSIWIERILKKVSDDPKYVGAVDSWKSELQEKDKFLRNRISRLYKTNVNLVAATCSMCGSQDFYDAYDDIFGKGDSSERSFDVVIMDEASKATPLEMAVPLVLGKKIILIGDHKQLPPMMDEDTIDGALERIGKKELAEKLQNAESQFKILFEEASKVRKSVVATLDTQYRMHEKIMNTIKQFYQETGGLKCGILETQDIPDLTNKGSRWHGLSFNPIITHDTHALWVNVHTQEIALHPGYKNEGELEAIDLVLKVLEQADGYKEFIQSQSKQEDKEIGIITFYSAQNREIRKRFKGDAYRMDVVDRFQGMERNIVIVSTVRSNKEKNIGFAKEIERINVAFSRARRLLIVVGNKEQFERNHNYAESIKNMETISYEQLKDAVK